MFLLSITVTANASVNDEIMSILKGYGWYENLLKYEQTRSEKEYTDYHLRHDIAKYLESVGLYNADNTEYCTYTGDNNGQKGDTCYIGTTGQNTQLLRALKTPEVKEHLSKVNAYIIVNGKDGLFFQNTQQIPIPYEYKKGMLEAMEQVPK